MCAKGNRGKAAIVVILLTVVSVSYAVLGDQSIAYADDDASGAAKTDVYIVRGAAPCATDGNVSRDVYVHGAKESAGNVLAASDQAFTGKMPLPKTGDNAVKAGLLAAAATLVSGLLVLFARRLPGFETTPQACREKPILDKTRTAECE